MCKTAHQRLQCATVTSITILIFNYLWITDEKINATNIIKNNLISTNWIKPRIFLHFQLTLNCKLTTGTLEHVVFKLLLLMRDANNYEIHIYTESSSLATNPPSYRLILCFIAVYTTPKIFYVYHNKIFGKRSFSSCVVPIKTVGIKHWLSTLERFGEKQALKVIGERCIRVLLQ